MARTAPYSSEVTRSSAIHGRLDIPALVGEAGAAGGLALINPGAWRQNPIVIQNIMDKTRGQWGELERDRVGAQTLVAE